VLLDDHECRGISVEEPPDCNRRDRGRNDKYDQVRWREDPLELCAALVQLDVADRGDRHTPTASTAAQTLPIPMRPRAAPTPEPETRPSDRNHRYTLAFDGLAEDCRHVSAPTNPLANPPEERVHQICRLLSLLLCLHRHHSLPSLAAELMLPTQYFGRLAAFRVAGPGGEPNAWALQRDRARANAIPRCSAAKVAVRDVFPASTPRVGSVPWDASRVIPSVGCRLGNGRCRSGETWLSSRDLCALQMLQRCPGRAGAAARARAPETENPTGAGLPVMLRGKDSNLDYLIQSQASYH
jgi:hypothetical protein